MHHREFIIEAGGEGDSFDGSKTLGIIIINAEETQITSLFSLSPLFRYISLFILV